MATAYDTLAPDTTAERIMTNPGVQRVPTPKLELFIVREFLDAAACKFFCDLIEIERRPSTIADPNGDHYFRTSETCDLDHSIPDQALSSASSCATSGIVWSRSQVSLVRK